MIYYTTNGAIPTESSDRYSGGITINSTTTLKAKAYKSGWNPSATTSASYVVTIADEFAGGSGTRTDPYLVQTPAQLNNVRNYMSSHFLQTANIDLSSYSNWEPIGARSKDSQPFRGSYNGGGFSISNLTIDRPGRDYVGLFGNCESYASLININLKNVNVKGRNQVGALAGSMNDTVRDVSHCSSTGSVSGVARVGGLFGGTTEISYCWSSCSVYGVFMVGGLAAGGDVISNSYATGNVFGTNIVNYDEPRYFGGLVGTGRDIRDCYARGNVTASYGDSSVGGLVGMCVSSSIVRSYSTGHVSGTSSMYTGGLSGWSSNHTITNCYWDVQTSGTNFSHGGEGKTTPEMKQQSTYQTWDFDSVWYISSNSYPTLRGI